MIPFENALKAFQIIYTELPVSIKTLLLVVLLFLVIPGAIKLILTIL